jgi:hypothetical protein
MKLKRPFVFILLTVLMLIAPMQTHASSHMTNLLSITGDGQQNPSYQRQVKNILIFQTAGWSQLPSLEDIRMKSPAWPLTISSGLGGRVAYLSKSKDSLLKQMGLIKDMNKDTAIAVLLMPDQEAQAGQYGACWNSIWLNAKSCAAEGAWQKPTSLFMHVRWAAWMKGIQVAPFFSINAYDALGRQDRAAVVVSRLKQFVDWYMTHYQDAVTLKTTDGKVVILTEGLPENTNLANDPAQNAELLRYMNSRTDILWINNLAIADANPGDAGANIYRSAAVTDERMQDAVQSIWGPRYLWHFLNRYGDNKRNLSYLPEATRLKWLNIAPFDPQRYPVVISQWNEYAETLVFEPSDHDRYSEYEYLQWRLSQQK